MSPNLQTAIDMIEKIAERSGEDRAAVFLDIIIQLIFSGKNTVRQQIVMNQIAAIYGIEQIHLKTDDDDVPF